MGGGGGGGGGSWGSILPGAAWKNGYYLGMYNTLSTRKIKKVLYDFEGKSRGYRISLSLSIYIYIYIYIYKSFYMAYVIAGSSIAITQMPYTRKLSFHKIEI